MDNIIQFPTLTARQDTYDRRNKEIGRMLLDMLIGFGKTVEPNTAHMRLLRDLHKVDEVPEKTWALVNMEQCTVDRETVTTLSTRLRDWHVPEFAVQAHTEFMRVVTNFADVCPTIREGFVESDLIDYYTKGFPHFTDVGLVNITAFSMRTLLEQPGVKVISSGVENDRYCLELAERLGDNLYAIAKLTIDALPLFLDDAARRLITENMEGD